MTGKELKEIDGKKVIIYCKLDGLYCKCEGRAKAEETSVLVVKDGETKKVTRYNLILQSPLINNSFVNRRIVITYKKLKDISKFKVLD